MAQGTAENTTYFTYDDAGNLLSVSDPLTVGETTYPNVTAYTYNAAGQELTVTDPKTWTQPWKVAFPLKRDKDYQSFEYACHEGNNSMRNILSGSRADERTGK